ncbi:MAG TPA: class F sortase [Mycobacteriales bacterium]|nr:class F sortase [Mycobacteriales bacterium]
MSRRERHPVPDGVPDPTRPQAPARRVRRRAARRTLLGGLGVLLIGGAAALGTSVVSSVLGSANAPRTASIPVPASTPQAVPPPPLPAHSAPAGLARSEPVRITLPRVGIDTMLAKVGLNADGTLKVPPNDHVAGWYSDGPAPGDAGGPPAVIAGHVDSYLGPAVFFNLRQVRPHDKVLVRRADGSTAVFVVYRVAQFDKKKFPAAEVYAPGPRAELRLITCTGTFDYGARSYLSDFVVYAALQPPTPAGTPTPQATPATPTPATDRVPQ